MNEHLIRFSIMDKLTYNCHFTAFMYVPSERIDLLVWPKNLVDISSGFAVDRLAASTYNALGDAVKQLLIESLFNSIVIHRYRVTSSQKDCCVLVSFSKVFIGGEMTIWHFELKLSIQRYTPRTCQLHFEANYGPAHISTTAPLLSTLPDNLNAHYERETARVAAAMERSAISAG